MNKKKELTTYQYNMELLKFMAKAIVKNPDTNFSSLLREYDFVSWTDDEDSGREYWQIEEGTNPKYILDRVKGHF